jgi:ribonuclease R
MPDDPDRFGELYIPAKSTGTAMTGDRVSVQVQRQGKRRGKMVFYGEVTAVLSRAVKQFVGTLRKLDSGWVALPDGRAMTMPVVLEETGDVTLVEDHKAIIDMVTYPALGQPAVGKLVSSIGKSGELDTETRAIAWVHGITDSFSDEALAEAERARDRYAETLKQARQTREDLSDTTVITIDPDDARDYDDAISLENRGDGSVVLGVHIADVAFFIEEGGALDLEARARGTSVYLPRKVVPMLPEALSNGICSLVEGQPRLTKTVFITYDAEGRVQDTEFRESIITSKKRLTYGEAQSIGDGAPKGVNRQVTALVRGLLKLARKIERRRQGEGMLHLDLPAVDLVFSKKQRVVDARPADTAYTHTMIEMFMVEANDAVAAYLGEQSIPFISRVHPQPGKEEMVNLEAFARARELTISKTASRFEIQTLLEEVRGQSAAYALNLAVLRSFRQATYSATLAPHYALASEAYCHFTSPIRRYPDLTVHRLIGRCCAGTTAPSGEADMQSLASLAEHCSKVERRAAGAEAELRLVMVLGHLATRVGERFDGVVTGVADSGIFVQWPRFLVEGMIRLKELGDEWWEVSRPYGLIRGERTGTTYRIGDAISVEISRVDVARRHLDLIIT